MPAHFPATLQGWCALPLSQRSGAQRFGGPGVAACEGWTRVRVPSGDQSIELFYDAAGQITAILSWGSKPPCRGACELGCVAGPADLKPAQLTACETQPPETDLCPSDGGVRD